MVMARRRSSSSSSSSGGPAITRNRSGSGAGPVVDIEVDQVPSQAAGATDGVAVVPSDGAAAPHDAAYYVQKALARLPADVRALAEDPKRHAKSKDPAWKYGYWPILGKKDQVECIFCRKQPHGGISRFKMHLASGYADVEKCGVAPAIVRKEMQDYMARRAKNPVPVDLEEGVEGEGSGDECEVVASSAPSAVPSSGNASKAARRLKIAQSRITSFTVAGCKPQPKQTKDIARAAEIKSERSAAS